MNKRQKAVQQAFINDEEKILQSLKNIYNQATEDITKKSKELQEQIKDIQSLIDNTDDEKELERLKSMHQSKVYQKQYQDALKKQIGGILDNMQVEEFKTVSAYLNKCYEEAFLGTLYDMQGQGMPIMFPIDQQAMVQAVQLDSQISEGLYSSIGENVAELKKTITSEVSRGIATGATFPQIAKQIQSRMTGVYTNKTGGALYRAELIARTEGHRIQCQSTMNACYDAKDRGADVVKKWDATLDGLTRPSHIHVDGEIKELNEEFSNGLMFPGDPSGGAAEVCNCRCALLQRARWAVKGGFTKMNNFTKQLETFESPDDYNEFKKAFFSKENRDFMNYVERLEEKYETKNFEKLLNDITDKDYDKYCLLTSKNPVFNKKTLEKNGNSSIMRMGVVNDAVNSKTVSTKINIEKQSRHIPTSKGFLKGRSYLDIDIDEAQNIVNRLSGTGSPIFDDEGEWIRKERVECVDYIGTHIDIETNKETKTNMLMIIYSKTGCHIVPIRKKRVSN